MASVIDIYFEDIVEGHASEYGSYLVTRGEIVEFAKAYDPQPFHLDDAAANASMLHGLSASGWHSAGILMRLACDGWVNRSASWGGPGVSALNWLKPVRPGDILRARRQIVSARRSKSRPQMGLVAMHSQLINQHDEVVLTQDNIAMLGLRGATVTPAQAPPPGPATTAMPTSTAVLACWYEDVRAGDRLDLGAAHFTAAGIIAFAEKYDPQPFHLDAAAAQRSHFGGLVASGWHSCASHMRLLVDARQRAIASSSGVGREPVSGPSPGVRDIVWPKPVYANDVVHFSLEHVRKRLVSRPGWGLVESRSSGVNQRGETVFGVTSLGFYPLRS